MTVAVSASVIGNCALAVDAAGNDRNGSLASQCSAQGIGIVALVREEIAGTVQFDSKSEPPSCRRHYQASA